MTVPLETFYAVLEKVIVVSLFDIIYIMSHD